MTVITRSFTAEFAADVRRDLALTPKQLQSKYLYDPLGSSLFDAICRLPWYRITRAETRLLGRHAGAIVGALSRDDGTIVELGCGSGEKLVLLAEALQAIGGTARVHLIDISSQALEQTEQRLGKLHFSVMGHQSTYEVGLRRAVAERPASGPMLVLLLGSNIGNFDLAGCAGLPAAYPQRAGPRRPAAARRRSRQEPKRICCWPTTIRSGSPRRSTRTCWSASTRSWAGTSISTPSSIAPSWNRELQRIEMHLVSCIGQEVTIPLADTTVHFHNGEYIWTESSYKYTPEQITAMGAAVQLATRDQWIDDDARFALTMFVAS